MCSVNLFRILGLRSVKIIPYEFFLLFLKIQCEKYRLVNFYFVPYFSYVLRKKSIFCILYSIFSRNSFFVSYYLFHILFQKLSILRYYRLTSFHNMSFKNLVLIISVQKQVIFLVYKYVFFSRLNVLIDILKSQV